jgi:hypothetical protein
MFGKRNGKRAESDRRDKRRSEQLSQVQRRIRERATAAARRSGFRRT